MDDASEWVQPTRWVGTLSEQSAAADSAPVLCDDTKANSTASAWRDARSGKFRFLDLAYELRSEIYAFCIRNTRCRLVSATIIIDENVRNVDKTPILAQTHPFIYAEFLDHVLRLCVFKHRLEINGLLGQNIPLWSGCAVIPRPLIPAEPFHRNLRHITIHWDSVMNSGSNIAFFPRADRQVRILGGAFPSMTGIVSASARSSNMATTLELQGGEFLDGVYKAVRSLSNLLTYHLVGLRNVCVVVGTKLHSEEWKDDMRSVLRGSPAPYAYRWSQPLLDVLEIWSCGIQSSEDGQWHHARHWTVVDERYFRNTQGLRRWGCGGITGCVSGEMGGHAVKPKCRRDCAFLVRNGDEGLTPEQRGDWTTVWRSPRYVFAD